MSDVMSRSLLSSSLDPMSPGSMPDSSAMAIRTWDIQFWRSGSVAPPSGRLFTAMFLTSSLYVLRPSFLDPVSLLLIARSASMTANPRSMA